MTEDINLVINYENESSNLEVAILFFIQICQLKLKVKFVHCGG